MGRRFNFVTEKCGQSEVFFLLCDLKKCNHVIIIATQICTKNPLKYAIKDALKMVKYAFYAFLRIKYIRVPVVIIHFGLNSTR